MSKPKKKDMDEAIKINIRLINKWVKKINEQKRINERK